MKWEDHSIDDFVAKAGSVGGQHLTRDPLLDFPDRLRNKVILGPRGSYSTYKCTDLYAYRLNYELLVVKPNAT